MKLIVTVALIGLFVAPLCVVVASWSSRRRSETDVFIPPNIKANVSTPLTLDANDEECIIRQFGSSATRVTLLNPSEYEIAFASYLPGPSWQTQVLLPLVPSLESNNSPASEITVDAKSPGSKEIVLWSADKTGKPMGAATVVALRGEWSPARVRWGGGATHLAVAVGSSKDPVTIRKVSK